MSLAFSNNVHGAEKEVLFSDKLEIRKIDAQRRLKFEQARTTFLEKLQKVQPFLGDTAVAILYEKGAQRPSQLSVYIEIVDVLEELQGKNELNRDQILWILPRDPLIAHKILELQSIHALDWTKTDLKNFSREQLSKFLLEHNNLEIEKKLTERFIYKERMRLETEEKGLERKKKDINGKISFLHEISHHRQYLLEQSGLIRLFLELSETNRELASWILSLSYYPSERNKMRGFLEQALNPSHQTEVLQQKIRTEVSNLLDSLNSGHDDDIPF